MNCYGRRGVCVPGFPKDPARTMGRPRIGYTHLLHKGNTTLATCWDHKLVIVVYELDLPSALETPMIDEGDRRI